MQKKMGKTEGEEMQKMGKTEGDRDAEDGKDRRRRQR